MNTRKKTIVMGILGLLLLLLAVGYAAAQTALYISGTATLEATWDVAITSISEGTAKGEAYNKSTPSYTGTTANFDVGLKKPGDEMEYQITITNNGTLDAYVARINAVISAQYDDDGGLITKDGVVFDNISLLKYGLKNGEVIKAGDTATLNIRIRQDEYEQLKFDGDSYKIYASISLTQNNNQIQNEYFAYNEPVLLDDNNVYRVYYNNNYNDDNIITLIKEEPLTLSNTPDLFNNNDNLEVDKLENYLNSTYKNSLPTSMKSKISYIGIPVTNFKVNNSASVDESGNLAAFLNTIAKRCVNNGTGQTVTSVSNCNVSYLTHGRSMVYPIDNEVSDGKDGGMGVVIHMNTIYTDIVNNTDVAVDVSNPIFTDNIYFFPQSTYESYYSVNTIYYVNSTLTSQNSEVFLTSFSNVNKPTVSQSFNYSLSQYLSNSKTYGDSSDQIRVYPVITIDRSAIK